MVHAVLWCADGISSMTSVASLLAPDFLVHWLWWPRSSLRHARPGPFLTDAPVEKAVLDDLVTDVPLFEEVRNTGLSALPVNITYPVDVHFAPLANLRPLAAADDPVNGTIEERAEVEALE